MSGYQLMQASGRPDGCTCEMVREPVWDYGNGPQPAEWEPDPLCWVHPSKPGTWWDPIQSSTPEWRAFMERDRSVQSEALTKAHAASNRLLWQLRGWNADALMAAVEEAWDEGLEAGMEWQQAGPSGIPHDPPSNPHRTATRGDAS